MQNSVWKKGIVVGIIFLFVGTSIVSSNANLREDENLLLLSDQNENIISTDWWDYNWSYRKEIMINHDKVDADLQNFPVLIANISSDFSDHAQSDGDDFVFIDETNSIQYNHEIEYYNSTSGELIAWVNVTSLSSSTDTMLWMYYGNSTCDSQENPTEVWDSNYVSVWHMDDLTTSIVEDSCDNYNGAKTSANNPIEFDTGKIGKCQDFSNDKIDCGDIDEMDGANTLTMSAWYYADSFSDGYWNPIIGKWNGASHGEGLMIFKNFNRIGLVCRNGANTFGHKSGIVEATTGSWYLAFYVYNGSGTYNNNRLKWYANDTEVALGYSGTIPSILTSNTESFVIGNTPDPNSKPWDGKIDEVRISDNVRSEEWIKASFHSQNKSIGFLMFGNEELVNYPPVANFTYTPEKPIQTDIIQFNDTSVDPDGNISVWLWDFGDGNTSTEQNPTHQYADYGNYTVFLNVTDDFGATNETSKLIVVANSKPIADYTYSPMNPIINETIYFTDASTDIDGIIVAWLWFFDDGYFSNLQNPTHLYPDEGTYNVTLTVTDDDGASDTVQKAIVVTIEPNNPPTTPSIDGSTSCKPGEELTFTFHAYDPDGDDIRYFIKWGDNNTEWTDYYPSCTNVTVKHTWDKKGEYVISAKAEDIHGAESDWRTLDVTIPKNRFFNYWWFTWLLNRFPILQTLLNILERYIR